MKYTVRVVHSSSKLEPKFEDFETDSRKDDDLDALHDEAVNAYTSAVQAHDHGHTVSLFRDGVTVHEALGTGTGRLSEGTDASTQTGTGDNVVEGNENNEVAEDEAVEPDRAYDGRHAVDGDDQK